MLLQKWSQFSILGCVGLGLSVGATIRHMVTGVPPDVDVDDFIASKNHPVRKLVRSLSKKVKGGGKKRPKIYRTSLDLPMDVMDLIQGLTHYNPKQRATVRTCTRHPWIASAMSPVDEREEVAHGGPVVYLSVAQ